MIESSAIEALRRVGHQLTRELRLVHQANASYATTSAADSQ